MKKLYILFFISIGANAAPVFNPLPESVEYREQLCKATKNEYQQFNSQLMELSMAKKDLNWFVDYAVTEELRDNALSQYKANC